MPDGIRREVGDATDPAAAKSLIDRIAAQAGPPEVLVNTIGTFRLGEAVAATPEDLKVLMDVNLGAALWLSQAVEPYMRQRGKGAIVHVSARPGTDPTAGMPCAPAPPIGASTPPAEELSGAPAPSSPAPPTDSAAPPPVSLSVKAMTLSSTPALASGRRRSATLPRTPRESSSATSAAQPRPETSCCLTSVGIASVFVLLEFVVPRFALIFSICNAQKSPPP